MEKRRFYRNLPGVGGEIIFSREDSGDCRINSVQFIYLVRSVYGKISQMQSISPNLYLTEDFADLRININSDCNQDLECEVINEYNSKPIIETFPCKNIEKVFTNHFKDFSQGNYKLEIFTSGNENIFGTRIFNFTVQPNLDFESSTGPNPSMVI